MDSSPSKMNSQPALPAAGVKRPAPTLLPAFEPFSSSPALPRPAKRQAISSPFERQEAMLKYPTPIPTSTTGIISSSPPQVHRAGHNRAQSSASERAPLSAVPTVVLPENGEALLMGRSSNSSHYQLSANRLISRIHLEARYIAASSPLEPNKVEIKCNGWNGAKLHCQGRTWELAKGDSFTSETEDAEIMLDVQDARVIIAWPEREGKDTASEHTDSTWDDDSSPLGRVSAVNALGQDIPSSPLRRVARIATPVSPTPAGPANNSQALSSLLSDSEEGVVKIYEDEDASEENHGIAAGNSQVSTQAATSFGAQLGESQSSDLSDPEDGHDPDEENDPIVHSFGPFGANLSSKMASFTAGASPESPRGRGALGLASSPADRSRSESTNQADAIPIVNHVVNQLAFSRLSSTPLSVIFQHLPADLKGASPTHQENKGLTKDDLRKLLNAAPCVGEIGREGKDAAGKPLESEYYYIPDEDTDAQRRAAVVEGLRKPSLRNCRKQHKQYYWKKPRTP